MLSSLNKDNNNIIINIIIIIIIIITIGYKIRDETSTPNSIKNYTKITALELPGGLRTYYTVHKPSPYI